jgi:hypothetical protein
VIDRRQRGEGMPPPAPPDKAAPRSDEPGEQPASWQGADLPPEEAIIPTDPTEGEDV